MTRRIRTTAAATACAVALAAAPAGAETITRDSKRTVVVEESCTWEVDDKGTPIIDGATGEPIAVKDENGEPLCTKREVSRSSAGSSEKWADETKTELGVGIAFGIVGALLGALLGAGMLFIESIDIVPLPPQW